MPVVSDASDVGGEPDIENISSFVYFTPSVDQIFHTTDQIIYRLPAIRARTNPDLGQVLNIDGTQLSLVANTPDLDIDTFTYLVTFDHVRERTRRHHPPIPLAAPRRHPRRPRPRFRGPPARQARNPPAATSQDTGGAQTTRQHPDRWPPGEEDRRRRPCPTPSPRSCTPTPAACTPGPTRRQPDEQRTQL